MTNKKIILLSGFLAAVAVMFLTTSCSRQSGASTFKTIEVEDSVKHPKGTADNHVSTLREPISDSKLSDLLLDLTFSLPASYMPFFLKTAEQRRQTEFETYDGEGIKNHVYAYIYEDEWYTHHTWTMTGYRYDDNEHILLIIQHTTFLDGSAIKLDKTLKYNMETKNLVEIERPADPLPIDKLIVADYFDDQNLFNRFKAYFSKKQNQKIVYESLNTNGYGVTLNFFELWNQKNDFDQDNIRLMVARYKWTGERFVLDEIVPEARD